MVDELIRAVQRTHPLPWDELKRQFPRERIQGLWEEFEETDLWVRCTFHGTPWTLQYYTWLFDECQLPFDQLSVPEAAPYFMNCKRISVLDCVFWIHPTDIQLLEFFLSRRAPSLVGLYRLLDRANHEKSNFSVELRLIEAGAKPHLIQRGSASLYLFQYYNFRQRHRAAILALLQVAKRREMRRWIARDVWRMIAKMMWQAGREYWLQLKGLGLN